MSTQSNQPANPGQQTDLGQDTQRQGGGQGQPGQTGQPEKVPEPRPADGGNADKTDQSGRNPGEPGFGTDDDTPQQGGM